MASWFNNIKQNIGYQLGSQGTFKNILPKGVDFGISEWLSGQPAKASYTPPPPPKPYTGPTYNYSPYVNAPVNKPQVNRSSPVPTTATNVNMSGGGDNGSSNQGNVNQGQPQGPSQEELLRQQYDALTQQLDAEYNSAISMAEGQESSLRGQAGTAEGQITNEAGKTRTALGQEQATKQQGVQSQLSTAETQGKSALQQARDLFRQTQQQNIAQLSATGLSSSSVAEALAERLGVETARRIAGVTGGLDEVRQNASKELSRINDYYGQRITQIQSDEQLQKQQIQQSLMSGLNQINTAKQQAASEKAARRAGLISQVQSQLASLAQQKQQFEQQLKLWATQKSQDLTPIVQDPNYLNTLTSTANKFNEQFSPTGFSFTPEVSYDKYGTMTGKIVSNKKPDEEDPMANPFAPGGY